MPIEVTGVVLVVGSGSVEDTVVLEVVVDVDWSGIELDEVVESATVVDVTAGVGSVTDLKGTTG